MPWPSWSSGYSRLKSSVDVAQGRNHEAVESAVLEWVHWFNTTRLFEPIGHVPPAEFEDNYYAQLGQLELPGVT